MIVHEIDVQDYYLYLLIDPRDDAVRYAGSTKHVERRYYDHLSGRDTTRHWVSEVRDAGHEIIMKVVGSVSQTDRFREEQALIDSYPNLLNRVPCLTEKKDEKKVAVEPKDTSPKQRIQIYSDDHRILRMAAAYENASMIKTLSSLIDLIRLQVETAGMGDDWRGIKNAAISSEGGEDLGHE